MHSIRGKLGDLLFVSARASTTPGMCCLNAWLLSTLKACRDCRFGRRIQQLLARFFELATIRVILWNYWPTSTRERTESFTDYEALVSYHGQLLLQELMLDSCVFRHLERNVGIAGSTLYQYCIAIAGSTALVLVATFQLARTG